MQDREPGGGEGAAVVGVGGGEGVRALAGGAGEVQGRGFGQPAAAAQPLVRAGGTLRHHRHPPGSSCPTQTTFENYPYLLLEEIYNRKGLKGRFAETELWFLLFSLVEARRQAAAVGERLGDVRPENVFLNEAGNIRVSNSLSWPLELTNLQKAFDKLPTYLAPEDLARLARGETADAPSDAAEAFSIGLSVLSAGNLAKYDHLYDLSTNELRLSALDEALSLWAHNAAYSEVLRGVVLLLLALSPEARLRCSELEELLRKHAEHVVKKENFVVDNAPPKLHDQILSLRTILQQSILIQGAPSPLVASEYHLDFKKPPE